jgi:alkylation response protein AidB-like acyl-CoA dehydrogenase
MARLIGDAAIPPRPDALDDEQRTLKRSVAEFAAGVLNDGLPERDRDAIFHAEGWKRCAEIGIQGLPVPEEYGGVGAPAVTIAAAMQGLGYGCADNGLLFSLGAQMWACETPIVRFGREEQKRRYLPGMCDGSLIAAHAISEPGSGSDAFSLQTSARRTGGGWVLNGSKTYATNAPDSDLFIVFGTTDRSLGFAGLCAFLIDRGTPGLEVGAPFQKMGLRSSHMSELFLSDCEVPADALLGTEGAGMVIFNHSMRWERALILAPAVGTMQRQLERCVRYAREREQFGSPIGKFQAVSHPIADMKLRLETSHLMLQRVAALLDADAATDLDAAMTKLHISEALVQSSLATVQIHGGAGYMTETGCERDVRDALAARLYSGTSELQRNVIAAQLAL